MVRCRGRQGQEMPRFRAGNSDDGQCATRRRDRLQPRRPQERESREELGRKIWSQVEIHGDPPWRALHGPARPPGPPGPPATLLLSYATLSKLPNFSEPWFPQEGLASRLCPKGCLGIEPLAAPSAVQGGNTASPHRGHLRTVI